jgi:hypothetical protein
MIVFFSAIRVSEQLKGHKKIPANVIESLNLDGSECSDEMLRATVTKMDVNSMQK